jgi:hypothetical protein
MFCFYDGGNGRLGCFITRLRKGEKICIILQKMM